MNPLKPPSWASVITAAEKRGRFTQEEVNQANSWATCAVGEQVSTRTATFKLASKYPDVWSRPVFNIHLSGLMDRSINIASKHALIHDAGLEFSSAVQDDDFSRARKVLRRVRRNFRKLIRPKEAR